MRSRLSFVLSLTVLAAASCDGGSAPVQVGPDGGDARDAADVAERAPDLSPSDAADAPDLSSDGGDARETAVNDASDVADRGLDADGPPDVAAEAAPEAGVEAPLDLPVEKPPATASWTLAPDPMCTATGAGCMDTGPVGGYQVTASGTCAGAPSVQLWFQGGMAAIAAGSYSVLPASGILDVIAMQAGKVGVLAERGTGAAHQRYWGQSGTVTVSAVGGARRITFTGVSLMAEGSTATTTLAADVMCP